MPEIGRPPEPNKFSNIGMAKKLEPEVPKGKVGSRLNEIAGRREEDRYVDPKKHNQMDKNSFLKLLAVQLSNQDPIKPMDQKQFAADLAQFSQLEQMTNMNKNLEKTTAQAPGQTKFHGASFLGKQVISDGASVKFDGKMPVDIPFYLPKNAKNALVRIFDNQGQMVNQIQMEGLSKGSQVAVWDGMRTDKQREAAGEFRIEVFGWDNNMEQFRGETQATGIVTGVEFEGDEIVFTVDGKKKVFLRDVRRLKLPNEVSSPEMPVKPETIQKEANQAYTNQSDI